MHLNTMMRSCLFGVIAISLCGLCHGTESNWTKVLLTEAAAHGAVCLDGLSLGFCDISDTLMVLLVRLMRACVGCH
eukprot:m.150552 g.150552  ORF g.150552 m.150552 type:complete len:76 (-) comp17384_c0_seq5:109-336(-)